MASKAVAKAAAGGVVEISKRAAWVLFWASRPLDALELELELELELAALVYEDSPNTIAASSRSSSTDSPIQKYTLQSTGVWETIRRFLAIDPNRSNGVPLNPVNRNPTPGSNDPKAYRDPVTAPAGDIAGNPYWQRDHRRHYPQTSVLTQPDVVGLLAVGSAAAPKVELVGDKGAAALVQVAETGRGGVAAYIKENGGVAAQDVFVNGLPPTPSGTALKDGAWQVYPYQIGENSYPEQYQIRSFQ